MAAAGRHHRALPSCAVYQRFSVPVGGGVVACGVVVAGGGIGVGVGLVTSFVVPVLVPLAPAAPVVPVLPELIDEPALELPVVESGLVEVHAESAKAIRLPSRAPWNLFFIRVLLCVDGYPIMRGRHAA